jgi:hypothetical protein
MSQMLPFLSDSDLLRQKNSNKTKEAKWLKNG